MIQIELPTDVAERLRRQLGDLGQAAKEALLIRAYREGQITHFELATGLGLDRTQTDELLNRQNVFQGCLTVEDLDSDNETLEQILGPVR
ncbi:MAG: UPF0175 family protein [Phycisphaerae bacterium]|nr:UPF0175 family protein [Phycisphaerae bacterium]